MEKELPMEMDWDCIRAVLLGLAALQTTSSKLWAAEVEGFSPDTVSYHIHLLVEAKLVEGNCSRPMSGGMRCFASRMTFEGQRLFSALRKKPVWEKIKGLAIEKGIDLGFDSVKLLAAHVVAGMLKG